MAKVSRPMMDYPAWQFFVAALLLFALAAVAAVFGGVVLVLDLVVGTVLAAIGLWKLLPRNRTSPARQLP